MRLDWKPFREESFKVKKMAEREVEIVPWIHSIFDKEYDSVIRYVQELPKNSSLGLEIPPPPVEIAALKLPHLYELLFECKRRGIRIIPLEAKHLLKLENDARREKVMVDRVLTAFKRFRFRKLPIIIGGFHVLPVLQGLQNSGIKIRVNTEIFSEKGRTRFRRLMLLRERIKDSKGIAEQYPQIKDILEETVTFDPERFKEWGLKLVTKVERAEEVRKVRLQRKLSKRRNLK